MLITVFSQIRTILTNFTLKCSYVEAEIAVLRILSGLTKKEFQSKV